MVETTYTILTGATSGIGYETAKKLYASGHFLILGNRNKEKSDKLAEELCQMDQTSHFEMIELDLASFESIKSFTTTVLDRYPVIDTLINNAGVFKRVRDYTSEGFEMTMGVNYLGTVFLTECLIKGFHPGSKIIMLSSVGCYWGNIRVKDNLFYRYINSFKTYFDSKLANLIYAIELKERLKDKGINVLAADPGIAYSKIFKWRSGFGRFLEKIQKRIMKTSEQGSRVVVGLVLETIQVKHGGILVSLKKTRKLPGKAKNLLKRQMLMEFTNKTISEKIKANR